MTNRIILKGYLRNSRYSHTIGKVDYYQAEVVTSNQYGEDIIPIKYKKFSNKFYSDGDKVCIEGYIRSYSHMVNGKSKVELYVFTYFDAPDNTYLTEDSVNYFELSGKICRIDSVNRTNSGKHNLHFIIANNIDTWELEIKNYLPSVVWGKLALKNSELTLNDYVVCTGRFHSRLYKKSDSDELFVAHELLIESLKKIGKIDNDS